MSSKRNRMSRSSSQGEVVACTGPMMPPIDSPINWEKKRATALPAAASRNNKLPVLQKSLIRRMRWNSGHDQPEKHGDGKSIWTLDSSEELNKMGNSRNCSEAQVDESFGAFWQACALCKRRLTDHTNMFMYGYLQVFCSVECRDAKIAVDDRFRTPSPQPPTVSVRSK